MAKGLTGDLERRVHAGPSIRDGEVARAREFLHRNSFGPASEYYGRLDQIEACLRARVEHQPTGLPAQGKRNYGGEAAGQMMQVQSIYDHVILSMCYAGQFNLARGRVKISHRFNSEGRVDFVELKFLRAMEPLLTGEIRKLLLIKSGQHLRRDWDAAEAFVLPVLPRELVFLHADLFRFARGEVLAWLVNLGHRAAEDLLRHLRALPPVQDQGQGNHGQLPLGLVLSDSVAPPVLERAAALCSEVEMLTDKLAVVRYTALSVELNPVGAG